MDGLIKDIFSRDLKETQSEVPQDRRAHQDHLELVMMVVQETQDLLDPWSSRVTVIARSLQTT